MIGTVNLWWVLVLPLENNGGTKTRWNLMEINGQKNYKNAQ